MTTWCFSMASIAETEKILEAAVAGIPQVARAIFAGGPGEHRETRWPQRNAVIWKLRRI
jgi:hypothetical protein